MKTRCSCRRRSALPAGLALLFLNGCALLPEEGDKAKFLAPPAMEKTLAEADKEAVRVARQWPRAEWWRDFHNEDLNRLLETALRDNPDLHAAVARVRQAEAAADYQAAEMLPAIASQATVLRGRFSEADIYGSLGGRTGTSAYIDPIVFRYHLDLWGKDRAALDAASGLARARGAELALARLILGTAMARDYFRLCAADEEVRLAAELSKSAEEKRRLAELRLERGLDTRDPVHAAEQRVAAARQKEAALLAETRILRHRLAALAGQGPDWGLRLPVSASRFAERFPLPEKLPLELLGHRPDVAAARWRAEAAAKAVHVARTNFYPDVNLVGFAGLRSVNIKDLFLSRGASLAYSVGPTVTLPLFDGGRLRAELKNQEAAYDAAVESYNRTVLEAVQQVADALAEWRKSQAEDAAQEAAVHAAESQAGLVGHRRKAGLATRMEALAAEEALLEQRLKLSALQGERFEHAVGLIAALGGGYEGAASGAEAAVHDE
jgi:NodT family efflux transporter outer membrane factor (OMF) lipoprotein